MIQKILFFCDRCLVPECESNYTSVYARDWLNYTIPYDDESSNSLNKCHRFPTLITTSSSPDQCSPKNFNSTGELITCDKYVHDKNDESTIQNQVIKLIRLNFKPIESLNIT